MPSASKEVCIIFILLRPELMPSTNLIFTAFTPQSVYVYVRKARLTGRRAAIGPAHNTARNGVDTAAGCGGGSE